MSKQNGNGGIPVVGRKPQNELDNFVPVIIFHKAVCYLCKKGTQADAGNVIMCRSVGELIARAKSDHSQISVLEPCTNPQLIIDYTTALIDATLLAELSDESLIK